MGPAAAKQVQERFAPSSGVQAKNLPRQFLKNSLSQFVLQRSVPSHFQQVMFILVARVFIRSGSGPENVTELLHKAVGEIGVLNSGFSQALHQCGPFN